MTSKEPSPPVRLAVLRSGGAMAAGSTVWLVALAVAGLCLFSWCYLLAGAGTGMSVFAMTTFSFPPPIPAFTAAAAWTPGYALIMLGMWFVMMIAMMLPGILIGLLARPDRQPSGYLDAACARQLGFSGSMRYLSGYLIAWLGFSLAATALQFGLERAGLLHGMLMWSMSVLLSAGLLIAAGLYQFTGWKTASVAKCCGQSAPFSSEYASASGMAGLIHGGWCVRRCVMLMLVLFAGGAMNLVWIIGLMVLPTVERFDGRNGSVRRWIGVLLLAAGGYLLLIR